MGALPYEDTLISATSPTSEDAELM